jgi:hypothetical protein
MLNQKRAAGFPPRTSRRVSANRDARRAWPAVGRLDATVREDRD